MRLREQQVLLFGPRRLVDGRIEVVVPALATLLADAAVQVFGDQRPLFGAVAVHQLHHQVVLLSRRSERGRAVRLELFTMK